MKVYDGGCHCGRIRFSVEAALTEAVICNCSICRMKGFVHVIVPRERFHLQAGEESLSTYTFNTHVAQHHFCRVCGIHAFYVPRSHPDKIDVNARCLEGVDVGALMIKPFDGRNWETAMAAREAARRLEDR